jgi:hypothetical protein
MASRLWPNVVLPARFRFSFPTLWLSFHIFEGEFFEGSLLGHVSLIDGDQDAGAFSLRQSRTISGLAVVGGTHQMRIEGHLPSVGRATKGGSLPYNSSNGNGAKAPRVVIEK